MTTLKSTIDEIVKSINALQAELEQKFEENRALFHYQVKQRRVLFEQQIVEQHRRLKTSVLTYLRRSRISVMASSVVIYALVVPMVLLDISLWVYQAICFPIYKIKKVPREDFIAIDRHHLAYLNGIEKLNCAYCGYANGLFAYAHEIGARTEAHWCPIKHARRVRGSHGRYAKFLEYGDADAYRRLKDPSA